MVRAMATKTKKPPTKQPAKTAEPRRGRPPSDKPRRKGKSVYCDDETEAWIEKNVPRGVSDSAFFLMAARHFIAAGAPGLPKK